MFRSSIVGPLCLAIVASVTTASRAGEFERIEGQALAGVPRSKDATPHTELTVRDLEALPYALRESRGTLLIATTDQGNAARLIVSAALYKVPGKKNETVPVLVVERFDTLEAPKFMTRLARGKDLILFDGFRLDLDSGQIVPEGMGGDLMFLSGPAKNPRLMTTANAKLYTVTKAPTNAVAESARPSVGRSVIPADFAGRYRLFANGQWSGTLALKVDDEGAVSGQFRSDLNGASYPVEGKAAVDAPQRVTFTIRFPRTEQAYDGLLWTEGKGAMAGSVTMLGHAFGFFAIREGGQFAPDGEDVGPIVKSSNAPGRHVVIVRKGEYTLDGQPKTHEELTAALKHAINADHATWVLVQVPADESFDAVRKAYDLIGSAGVSTVRLGPAEAER